MQDRLDMQYSLERQEIQHSLDSQDPHSVPPAALVVYHISQLSMLKLKSQAKLPQSWNVLLLNMCWSGNHLSPPLPLTLCLPPTCPPASLRHNPLAYLQHFQHLSATDSQRVSQVSSLTWLDHSPLLLLLQVQLGMLSLRVNVCNSFDVCFLSSPPLFR